jgi:hypothetical protein
MGGLFQPRCTVPAKEKTVWFCPLCVGPFSVLNPRHLKPDCAHGGYDISEGFVDIAILGEQFYHALP